MLFKLSVAPQKNAEKPSSSTKYTKLLLFNYEIFIINYNHNKSIKSLTLINNIL